MHRVVQLTVRAELSKQGTLSKWQAAALRLAFNSFAENLSVERETEDLTASELLRPHATIVLEYKLNAKPDIDRSKETGAQFVELPYAQISKRDCMSIQLESGVAEEKIL